MADDKKNIPDAEKVDNPPQPGKNEPVKADPPVQEPVSYTHLDVYKRQAFGQRDLRLIPGGFVLAFQRLDHLPQFVQRGVDLAFGLGQFFLRIQNRKLLSKKRSPQALSLIHIYSS